MFFALMLVLPHARTCITSSWLRHMHAEGKEAIGFPQALTLTIGGSSEYSPESCRPKVQDFNEVKSFCHSARAEIASSVI